MAALLAFPGAGRAQATRPATGAGEVDRPDPTYKGSPGSIWVTVAYDLDWDTRAEGLVALGRLVQVDPSLVPALVGLLDDPDPKAEQSASNSLVSVALARPETAGRVVDALAARIDTVPAGNWYSSGYAFVDDLATVARRYPDVALPALRRAADHPNRLVRLSALEPLLTLDASFGPDKATDVLTAVLDGAGDQNRSTGLGAPVTAATWITEHSGVGGFTTRASPDDRRRLAASLAGLIERVDPDPATVERDDEADRQLGHVAGALLALRPDAASAVPVLQRHASVEVRLGYEDGGGLFLTGALSRNSTTRVTLGQVAAMVGSDGEQIGSGGDRTGSAPTP